MIDYHNDNNEPAPYQKTSKQTEIELKKVRNTLKYKCKLDLETLKLQITLTKKTKKNFLNL